MHIIGQRYSLEKFQGNSLNPPTNATLSPPPPLLEQGRIRDEREGRL